jgi:putative flippase GtrA
MKLSAGQDLSKSADGADLEPPRSLWRVDAFAAWDVPATRQFLAFLVVGMLNTLFGYGVFAVLYWFSNSYRLAIVLATSAGIVFNFYSMGRLVFSAAGVAGFAAFVGVYILICGVNILLMNAATSAGMNVLIAQFVALLFLVPLSFALNKWLVFGAER